MSPPAPTPPATIAPIRSARRRATVITVVVDVVFALLIAALFVLLIAACPARAAVASGTCDPPRTRVVLVGLADATDHAWEVWTGTAPGALVTRLLADSLRATRGREVVLLANPLATTRRAMDDAPALEAAREMNGEIVVTGTVLEFTQEDRREAGKFWRWGVGAPDARQRARVRVAVRVLDAVDGSVIIETQATRERNGRATSTVGQRSLAAAVAPEALLGQALGEALSDLAHTIELRLEARWQATVETITGDECMLDAGTARGHFTGQRLEVWRAGIETYDEDLVRLAEDVRVGALVVTGLPGAGRVFARVTEGEVRPGDRVRVCSGGASPVLSLRR